MEHKNHPTRTEYICKKCKTEKKCRHDPEHRALCFHPSCECGELK